MQGQDDFENGGDGRASDAWLASVARLLLHPLLLQIADTLWREDRPLSARDLAAILQGDPGTIAYQLRRLRKFRVVTYADTKLGRHPLDIKYELVKEPESDGR